MSIDYKQLESMVKEALGGDGVGGVMAPSAPEGVPHRMPAADRDTPIQDRGDEDANNMYEIALAAREATEKLVEALDEPIYDGAYEHAFKASACLRKALNDLEAAGAYPMPDQRVVAPSKSQQPYGTGGSNAMNAYSMGYADFGGGVGLEEQDDALKGFGSGTVTQQAQAKGELDKSKAIAKGDTLGGVDNRERSMLVQIEKVLTDIAEKDNLIKYRTALENILKNLLKVSAKQQEQK
jgi:hypothetical protein